MKKRLFMTGIVFFCGLAVFALGQNDGGSQSGAGNTFVMNIGSAVSDSNPSTLALQSFKTAVEKRTNGKLKVNIYANSALGSEQDMISQLIAGTLEGSMQMGAANWEGYNEEAGVALLPFLFPDIEKARKAWNGEFGKKFAKEIIEPTGCKVLSVWESGYRHMTNNIRPVKVPADMKGIKFRTNNNNMKVKMFKALDGNVIMMSFSEVFTALQNGTIDGQENPLANIYTSSIQEVQKYLSLTGHMYDAAPFVCSKKWFDGLPAEYQNILMEEADKARAVDLKENDEGRFLELLKKSGIKVNEVDKAAFQEKVQPVWKEFSQKYGDEWLKLAKSAK
nr:DctP family TRAP transporter solute-binding subunit [Treponema socranskii]